MTSTDNLTKYDIQSIMHYDGTLRGRFSYPVMTDKKTGKGIEVNKKMSPLDIQKLKKMYPCKSTSPVCGEFLSENFVMSMVNFANFYRFNKLRSSISAGHAR